MHGQNHIKFISVSFAAIVQFPWPDIKFE